ncbi:hypothetical protein CUJ83_11740 [Methanocella sp. CWC-04]|uniref:Uncharacterized protein n=1 Tax=Methanooceanicella nereidis TaxID=2052831 RepID=A0AAP2RDL3_9EURY|nr:hypothetical protein [Methanocella sp. CWC-04]MCD1295669.1 hypothetical protein [Methanocella sp. CWC-04]
MGYTLRIAVTVLACLILIISLPVAMCADNGVKVYMPTTSTVTVDQIPFIYNGSFVVLNDGHRDGVYTIRVSVDYPDSIRWVNISRSVFVLKPGETEIVHFSIGILPDQAQPGYYDFIFTPTLLPDQVEPYMDPFANYVSIIDKFRFTVIIPDTLGASLMSYPEEAPPGTPVVFEEDADGRKDLIQYPAPLDEDRTVTLIDRAIRLNSPGNTVVGETVPLSVTIFREMTDAGITIMCVSPDGTLYPVEDNSFTFDREGKWAAIVLVGNEILLGKPIDVVSGRALFTIPDMGTLMAALALLLLLSVIPIWIFTGRREKIVTEDPYSDISYKAYVVKKYMGKFDKSRLKRTIDFLWDEYNDLLKQGVEGRKEEARASLEELRRLAKPEKN